MATYIPNATQTTEPVESRTVESAALEFRTLKASINARIEDVQDGLDTEIVNRIAGDANLQTQNNAQDVRLQAIEAALLAIGEGGLPGTVYVQRLSGTGAQTAFTLNVSVPTSALIDVFINGVYQNKDTFTISGTSLTFSEAPPAGTDNIEVVVSITIANVETDASLVSFRATDSTAVVRTAQDKLREWVSVKDFGGDPAADCAAALVLAGAATTGVIYIPAGVWTATATTSNSAAILGLLNRIRCDGALTINLAAGIHNFTSQVVVNSPDAQRIQVLGASTVQTAAISQVSVTGSAKAYSVTIGVASSAGISVDDYVRIGTDVTGTGDFYAHAGIWKVTSVDSGGANRLTLLHTHHGAAFPANTLTGGTVTALKTTLKFVGCDGFRFEGGQPLGLLDRVAIVGDYDVAAATGTTGTHGIVTSTPLVAGGGDSNAPFNAGGFVTLGRTVGVSGFGEQGVVVSGRGMMVANNLAVCSNRKRGIYSEGGHIRCKFAICSGNGEDGFIADTTGFIQAALSIAAGNGLDGYWSTNHSLIACSQAVASGNLSDGFEARGMTRIGADNALALNNGARGFSASDGGMVDASGATANGNSEDGFGADFNSTIDCNNSTSTNNGDLGYDANFQSLIDASGTTTVSGNVGGSYRALNLSIVREAGGALAAISPTFTNLTVSNIGTFTSNLRVQGSGGQQYRLSTSSIGDLNFNADATGRFVMMAGGIFRPAADNTQTLGRSAQRWSEVFAGNAAINTSDAREKQHVRELSDAERAVAIRLKSLVRAFKFNDAVARKGDGARIHVGVIAQDVQAAFEAEGLSPFSYSLLCYDSWGDEFDGDGNLTTPAGGRYGIRYEELLAFIIAAL